MASSMRTLNRRAFMSTGSAGLATLAAGLAKPSLSRAADRPLIPHGLQSGDVTETAGVVWTRADRPSRALIEIATTDRFTDVRHAVFIDALPESDFTAKVLLPDLPAG